MEKLLKSLIFFTFLFGCIDRKINSNLPQQANSVLCTTKNKVEEFILQVGDIDASSDGYTCQFTLRPWLGPIIVKRRGENAGEFVFVGNIPTMSGRLEVDKKQGWFYPTSGVRPEEDTLLMWDFGLGIGDSVSIKCSEDGEVFHRTLRLDNIFYSMFDTVYRFNYAEYFFRNRNILAYVSKRNGIQGLAQPDYGGRDVGPIWIGKIEDPYAVDAITE